MVTHSSILAWRIPMDRGTWRVASPRGLKELDTTERLLASILYFLINSKLCKIISVGSSMEDYLSTVLSLKNRVVIFF